MQDSYQPDDLDLEDNAKIMQMIEEGVLSERFEKSEGWKIIDKVCKEIAKSADRKWRTIEIKPENMYALIELQVIARIYGDVLGNIRNSYIQVGKMAFEEAKLRGLIEDHEKSVSDTE